MRPICVDIFAGAGGLSLGFEQAGFDVRVALESDPVHAITHAFNFPYTALLPVEIQRVTGEVIRQAGSIKGDIDVLVGGPPCQGFSLIGKRSLDDPRNFLVLEYARLVAELKPRYFVFENVKGLTVGRHARFLDELADYFWKIGYEVVWPWRILNAIDFGVPQHRERLFLLGARRDCPLPAYPAPITRSPDIADLILPPAPTCREALGDIPDADRFDALLHDDEVYTEDWGEPSSYARLLRCLDDGAWYFGYRRRWEPNLLTSSARTRHTSISRRRFARTPPGETEPISRFFRLRPDGVCNTLRAGTDGRRGAFTSPRPIHYRYPRCLTVREMARLHGFPDWFRFHATKWHGARQVGNAVPVPLARAVASMLVRELGVVPEPPERTLMLGRKELLKFSVREAAAYLGISAPLCRRTTKSPYRKRKQEEIEEEEFAPGA